MCGSWRLGGDELFVFPLARQKKIVFSSGLCGGRVGLVVLGRKAGGDMDTGKGANIGVCKRLLQVWRNEQTANSIRSSPADYLRSILRRSELVICIAVLQTLLP